MVPNESGDFSFDQSRLPELATEVGHALGSKDDAKIDKLHRLIDEVKAPSKLHKLCLALLANLTSTRGLKANKLETKELFVKFRSEEKTLVSKRIDRSFARAIKDAIAKNDFDELFRLPSLASSTVTVLNENIGGNRENSIAIGKAIMSIVIGATIAAKESMLSAPNEVAIPFELKPAQLSHHWIVPDAGAQELALACLLGKIPLS